jgi:uridine kinase
MAAGVSSLSGVVAAIRAWTSPADMRTRVIAVDGPGGAGKSTLAAYLARELDAVVVSTDDFASWDNPIDWWPELINKVLAPLAAGRKARYTPTSWGGPPKSDVVIEPGGTVVLEGVSASREAFRPYLAYSIWIETPRDLRLRRGLARDGEGARDDWDRWMAEEDAYVEGEQPAEHVDVVLPGDADLWT